MEIKRKQLYLIGDAKFLGPPEVYRGTTAVGTKNFVALIQQWLAQISTVLSCDSSDERTFCHCLNSRIGIHKFFGQLCPFVVGQDTPRHRTIVYCTV